MCPTSQSGTDARISMDDKMFFFNRKLATLAIGLALALTGAAQAASVSTVKVTLWDKGPDSATPDDAHPMGFGSGADMTMAMLGITTDVTAVPAGTITFDVTNNSKDILHEMILSPVPADGAPLPYIASDYKVDEDAASHLGEVSELDPGKGGKLTVDLVPGRYILFCNIPAHFVGGMWTVITVTP